MLGQNDMLLRISAGACTVDRLPDLLAVRRTRAARSVVRSLRDSILRTDPIQPARRRRTSRGEFSRPGLDPRGRVRWSRASPDDVP